jgi:hypothetical protein
MLEVEDRRVTITLGNRRYPESGADASATIDVSSPAARVYAALTHIEDQPLWSPEVIGASWLGGASGANEGARFAGRNRVGRSRWSTVCEVEVARPGEEFTFRVVRGAMVSRTRWSFRLQPLPDGGTRLTETFTVLRANPAAVRSILTWLRGGQERGGALIDNLRVSLTRLAEGVEGSRLPSPPG